ncbi:MAG TPA: histidine kinase dimerization/phospho-acceptor domain-containing protein, partial [Candidatus Nanopelagicales bacterium]|nr:histidine kinase dimerization/phospho-acceptor domain-containing protein [Candidatus Nanopelagicales bacterium]
MNEQDLLSDRMASLGTLAAGVAHEINNPIAYIYLNLEIAARELAALGDPRLARAEGALADALEGAARVRGIVGDLKTFARAGGEPLGPVDVREILDAAAGLATNELRRRARIVRDYGPTPPAQGNRSRLGQ